MRVFVNIYRRYHESKRILEYNRLKLVLNLSSEQNQRTSINKQRPTVKQSLILKDIGLSREITERPSSQSASLILLKEKLAKVVKEEPGKRYRNSTLELIDRLYNFQQKRTGLQERTADAKQCQFHDISDIPHNGSWKHLAEPPTALSSAYMRKNNRPKVSIGVCNPFVLGAGKPTHDRKRMSMENMRSVCLLSERSRERRNRKISQEGKRTNLQSLPRSKSPLFDKQKPDRKKKNKRGNLASTDTSYERPRTNLPQTPLPNDKAAVRRVVTPSSSSKPKHLRVSSQQLQPHRRSMNDLPTVKSPKLKITINQNNVFNIVVDSRNVDGRKELLKTPNRPLKKHRK